MTRSASSTRRNARVRCAIYTRKSSEEGLDQEFNSLQAQRETCEAPRKGSSKSSIRCKAQREGCGAFINCQPHEGWVCLPAYNDDGGFSARR